MKTPVRRKSHPRKHFDRKQRAQLRITPEAMPLHERANRGAEGRLSGYALSETTAHKPASGRR